MRRLDFYVQHLVRHNADAIQLVSGRPVTFRFATGDRTSNKSIDHTQLVELVQESAPEGTLETIRSSGEAAFDHDAAGTRVTVTVHAAAPNVWQAVVEPAKSDPPPAPVEAVPLPRVSPDLEIERPLGGVAAGAGPFVPGARPSPAPERASLTPPAVASVEGEPKLNQFLREMVAVGASDLHVTSGSPPMVRLHGEIQQLGERPPLRATDLEAMLGELLPARNRAEWEETSDTDFAHEIEGVARFRANYFLDRHGPGAVFRQIPYELLSVEQLGISKRVLDLCWLTKGLVVVTGPTGSGKSTTLATLVDFINDNRSDHIITIEDPIEFVHQNKRCLVNQREVGMHTRSFKRALRAALREDPDIVLVGEMRDLETIAIAIETAETGHLVFGTLHTTSAASTVDRIIDQFPPDRQEQIRVMLSESLRGVIAQVLCKKKGGGRVAAYEILIATSAVSNLIREGKTYQLTSVMQTGRNLGMQTLNDHLFHLVKTGVVEAREAYMKSNDKQALKDAFQRGGIALDL